MKKVIIWGSNGFVGTYLTSEMKSHGYYVIGTDIVSKQNEGEVDEYYVGNILDAAEVDGLIAEKMPDYIVNLAGMSSVGASWRMPQKTMDINAIGSINIMEAVKKYSLKTKILLIGSSEEYEFSNKPLSENCPLKGNSPYSISKIAQEMYADLYRKEYGLNIVCTRTFNHTGLHQDSRFVIPSFVKQVAELSKEKNEPREMLVGNLEIARDFGDVRDMVCAYRILLENVNNENVYNIGSGDCYKLKDILNHIMDCAGVKADVVVDPSRIRPDDNMVVWGDITRICKEYNWKPKYSIFDAIENMLYEGYGVGKRK